MILRSVLRLSVAAALLGAVWPASAQTGVPLPQPRPAQMNRAPAPPAQVQMPPPAPVTPAPAAAQAIVAPAPETPVPPPVAAAPVAEPTTPAEPANTLPPATAASAADDTPLDLSATAAATPSGGSAAATGVPMPLPPPSDIQPAPGASLAAAPAQPPRPEQTLGKVNTYFNGISTLVGNFTQIGPDGSRADGKFFLRKPGKVRFYYQRPSTTDIIADGRSLVVRDRRLATQDVYPLSQTPLKFLLSKNLDLARDSKVTGVHEEPGLVSVAIEEETTFGGKARILIVFGTDDGVKYELKQWTITDPQGLNTTVSLSELDTATKPDEKLFAVDYSRDIRRN